MVLIFNPENNFTNYKLFDLFIAHHICFEVIDPTKIYSISIEQNHESPTVLIINEKRIFLDSISCIFSSSSNLNLCMDFDDSDFKEFSKEEVLLFLNSEWRKINEFIAFILQKIPHLSIPYDNENKLKTNEIAKNIGFRIPDSIITTHKRDIEKYFSERAQKTFVAKRVNDFLSGTTQKGEYFQHESIVLNDKSMDYFQEVLFPSTSQVLVDYIIEVRSVYIDGGIFSVARHLKSSDVDMPFVLDTSIQSKIIVLMRELGLTFGSIDLLIDDSNNYYFLEINPHGQYDIIEVLGDFDVYNKIFEFIYEREKSALCNS
ncbi:hypothetical protein M9991_00370 [Chryseobacterium gallinarum]|uniref:hypothetical protein n=1 Tax=Chryseobacterium gallinarum TaxID=1324352 RepID=UPI0020241EE8|nr:hypothetical protein [Chryseobacterium gallinarum]MCL8535314.1 hypothetical protein [Chryseobacterium gallinarum]